MTQTESMFIYLLNYLTIIWAIMHPRFLSKKFSYGLTLLLCLSLGALFFVSYRSAVLLFYFIYLLEFFSMKRFLSNWLLPPMVLLFQYALTTFVRLVTFYLPSYFIHPIELNMPFGVLFLAAIQSFILVCLAYLVKRLDKKYAIVYSLKGMTRPYRIQGSFIFLLFLILVTVHTYSYIRKLYFAVLLISLLLFSITILVISFFTIRNKNHQQAAYLEALKLSMKEEKNNYELAREYRHDFRSILLALKEYMNSNDLPGAQDFLEQTILDSEHYLQEYRLVQLAAIKNAAVRGLFSDFIKKSDQHGIYLELKINDQDESIPLSQIDFVRAISIVLNNAFEATLLEKEKYVYLTLENTAAQWQLEILNPLTKKTEAAKIAEKNFSTKSGHSGLGLYTLNKLSNKYSNFFWEAQIKPNQFGVKLVISK